MTTTRLDSPSPRGTVPAPMGPSFSPDPNGPSPTNPNPGAAGSNGTAADSSDATPLRKAAILLVSLEQPLASQLLAQLDRPAVEAVTLEIARLDRLDPAEQQSVLEEFYGLGLRRLRFVFDDLARLDDRDIQEAYDEEDAATWALGLAGAARPVQEKVLGALPAGAAEVLRDHLARLGPFRLVEAEAAQAEVAERFRRLHDQGRLTLPDPNGQEAILV
jgi:flagellar motor switch protein FliG